MQDICFVHIVKIVSMLGLIFDKIRDTCLIKKVLYGGVKIQ